MKETTADPDQTGLRKHVIETGIRGFRRFVVVIAQNNSNSLDVETRSRQLAIVSFMCSIKYEYDYAGHVALIRGNPLQTRVDHVPSAGPETTMLGNGECRPTLLAARVPRLIC